MPIYDGYNENKLLYEGIVSLCLYPIYALHISAYLRILYKTFFDILNDILCIIQSLFHMKSVHFANSFGQDKTLTMPNITWFFTYELLTFLG